ncbi:MAG: HU family DNA-binding protein [Rickettsiales bacterium]|nr:HU family DNA-binding protein [Rickettsiales bacterium]
MQEENNNKITKEYLAKKIFQQIGIPKRHAYKIVQMFFETILQGLKEDEIVKITQFGTFKLLNKNPRLGRNLNTMEPVIIKPRKIISFKAHPKLKNFLNAKQHKNSKNKISHSL